MTLCEHLEAAIALAPEGEVKDALEAILAQAGCGGVVANSGGGGNTDPDKKDK